MSDAWIAGVIERAETYLGQETKLKEVSGTDIGDAKKYYFLSFAYKYRSNWSFGSKLVEVHPLEWQYNCHKNFHDADYEVISWQEITKELYDKYKGQW